MTTYEIKIPGASFEPALEAMKQNLVSAAQSEGAIPFELFFDYFQLTAGNAELKDKLLARGSFVPTVSTSEYRNSGPLIDHTATDVGPEGRTVNMFIAPIVTVGWSYTAGKLEITFKEGDVILGVDQMPPELGFGNSFMLVSIVWDERGVRYIAQEDGAPDHVLILFVDVGLTEGTFVKSALRASPNSAKIRLLARSISVDRGCCDGFEANNPSPAGPLCVNLHAKILADPNTAIEQQVIAMNDIFRLAEITVQLQSVERLDLPEFNDLEIGACVQGQTTDEQRRLFNNRNNAAPEDICAYWVETLTSNSGSVIGCAAHPPGIPALVMTPDGTDFVLAHEVGHVLGLFHVDASDRLNLMRPSDDFDDPPPDLSSDQHTTMRWSQWLDQC